MDEKPADPIDPAWNPSAAAPGHAPPPGTRTDVELGYEGEGSELLGVGFVNWLLTLVTLGFYYPWARARLLHFMIGSVRAGTDRFTFHGNGRELFWGMLRAWLLFGLPMIVLLVLGNYSAQRGGLAFGWTLLFYAVLAVFASFALIGSLRYRASRTSWRGIRFGFDGRFGTFGPAYLARLLLFVVTWGIAYPYVANWRRRYVLEHSRFGSESFGYDGEAGELMPTYLACWFLTIPTLGLSLAWFHARQQAYFWNHTTLGDARFKSTLTGGEWVMLSLVNGLLVAFTLGIAAPWAYVRVHRLFLRHLSLEGVDLASIHARSSDASATGEGAADLLSHDAGIDIG